MKKCLIISLIYFLNLFEEKRSGYEINCEVLCFIGQGGKACNCNYAPFVGRK